MNNFFTIKILALQAYLWVGVKQLPVGVQRLLLSPVRCRLKSRVGFNQ